MNRPLLVVLIAAMFGATACSNTPKTAGTAPVPEDARTAVKDTRISTQFQDQGITMHYSLTGKLERIEVMGTAPTWRGNPAVLAEIDAKEKLVKFVHGESVSTETRMRVLSRSLDRARDNTLNLIENNLGEFQFDADELDRDIVGTDRVRNSDDDNASRRTAQRVERSMVDTVNTITAAGRLTGVRKVSDAISRDGRVYMATYQWSERDQATSEFIRGRMR